MDECFCELADLIIKKNKGSIDRKELAEIIKLSFDEELTILGAIFL